MDDPDLGNEHKVHENNNNNNKIVDDSDLTLIVKENFDPGSLGMRHLLALLGFIGVTLVFIMRVNLSVAIVAMTNVTTNTKNENETSSEACPAPDTDSSEDEDDNTGEFDWDEQTQGLILGAFFYGYILTSILGGILANYFGGKIVVGVSVFLTAILTLFSPLAARSSSILFSVIRALEGAALGIFYPGMGILMGSWYPKMERSKFITYISAGLEFGTVIGMLGSGWLCSTDFLGGWPSVFYVSGVLAIIWVVLWMVCIKDHAEDHPWISKAELQYIKEGCPKTKVKHPIPWILILTSKCFWVVIICHFGQAWGLYALLSGVPAYLDRMLHMNMTKNGLYSALPFVGGWICSIIYGNAVDYCLKKEKLSLVNVRKISTVIGGYGPTLCLIGMCFVNCSTTLAIVVLFISCTINATVYCGFICSFTDLSPNFAGTLIGISNTISGTSGFITPYIMGVLTDDNETLPAWRGVFLSSALVIVVTSTVYVFFITTETQPWNDPKPPKELKDKPFV